MNNTFISDCAITEAKLRLTKVFPTPGLGPEIISTLFLASIIAKCKLVLKFLIASIEISAGFFIANKEQEDLFNFVRLSFPSPYQLSAASLKQEHLRTHLFPYHLIVLKTRFRGKIFFVKTYVIEIINPMKVLMKIIILPRDDTGKSCSVA